MDKKKALTDNLSAYFLRKNYKKKGNTFLADNGKTVSVFNLQKSAFGDSVYLNIGLYFKNKENDREIGTIKMLDTHFTGRYYQILGLQGDDFDIAAIENASDFAEDITLNIENKILPLLLDLSSNNYLKYIIEEEGFLWKKMWLQNITKDELLKLVEPG